MSVVIPYNSIIASNTCSPFLPSVFPPRSCVSSTNISMNAVFPWCKCPTSAIFRTWSGKLIRSIINLCLVSLVRILAPVKQERYSLSREMGLWQIRLLDSKLLHLDRSCSADQLVSRREAVNG